MKITIVETQIISDTDSAVPVLDKETGHFSQFPMIAIIGRVSNIVRQNNEVSFSVGEATATIKEEDAPEWLVDGVRVEIDFVAMKLKKL
jgi:hypothetical protein